MTTKRNSFIQIISSEYVKIFVENWSLEVGGLLIAAMSIITFAWSRPWGVVGGLRNWGDWFLYSMGIYEIEPASAFTYSGSILCLGLFLGALSAAFMAKQFAFRIPPLLEVVKAVVGAILMGTGAAFAGGCNIGGFYSSISALSFSGLVMTAGLIPGAYAGLKYLYWEVDHLPSGKPVLPSKTSSANRDKTVFQPYIGLALILGGYLARQIYCNHGYVISGGLLLCGMAFGFILHRSRFCFVRCYREPFMTGDASPTKVVILSLSISILGFLMLKWLGFRPETANVAAASGLGGFLGGFIFGFGMLLVGGCGSGTLWRAAEGQVKLMIALIVYALSTSLVKTWIRSSAILQSLKGSRVYLPDYIGYPFALGSLFIFLCVWYLTVCWNEETEKFVISI